ncbi:hypothetical protein N8D56_08585 [Devosia sp. A8/3-2]|nr:hypothetical protein N8D56_08585 [Devosia sp. A8/3-2]
MFEHFAHYTIIQLHGIACRDQPVAAGDEHGLAECQHLGAVEIAVGSGEFLIGGHAAAHHVGQLPVVR